MRFSTPMTSLGDPRQESPFTIDCPAKGTGRWADDRNWIYDFDHDLPGGVRCTFTLKADVKTLSGARVASKKAYIFDTGGPNIADTLPYEGNRRIDENQIFFLALDAPAIPKSIEDHAWCSVEGIGEQVPIHVLTGDAREKAMTTLRTLGYRYRSLLREGDEPARAREDVISAVRCQRTLPPATNLSLVWGKGITAPSGLTIRKSQVLKFRTRPAFSARFSCQRTNADAPCLPMMDMNLGFSAPIPTAMASKIALVSTDGTRQSADLGDNKDAPTVSSITFKAPFAPNTNFAIELPKGLKDDSGRPLQNAKRFPLSVHTDVFPPLIKFASNFGIIESRAGAILPVTVRNVEPVLLAKLKTLPQNTIPARVHRARDIFAMLDWMKRAKEVGQWRGSWVKDKNGNSIFQNDTGANSIFEKDTPSKSFDIPRPKDGKAFEVIGIPLKKPGFYAVELQSKALGQALLGRDTPRYVATTALVTNMAVHFLWGREGSLIWVTALDSGKPVSGAKVSIGDTCTRDILWNGTTDKDGTARVGATLHEPSSWGSCYSERNHPLVISAANGDDFSFTLSEWNDGIAPYDFDISQGGEWQANIAHTVFDRTLLRAGETVSMKHYLRRHTATGFALPPKFTRKSTVQISHDGSGQSIEFPIEFSTNGSALSQYEIPKDARLGQYSVYIKLGDEWKSAGGFRVEEFRLPTMEAILQGPTTPLINTKTMTLDVMVRYLSGGGASGLPIKVRTLVRPTPARFSDYADYTFDAQSLATNTSSTGQGEDEGMRPVTGLIPARLDGEGALRLEIKDLPTIKTHNTLTTELEYRDASGQILTHAARFDLWPAAKVVGIKTEGWAASVDNLKLHVIALNVDGTPAASSAVEVKAFARKRFSYRKRLIGGFYSYENFTKIEPLDLGCSGTTGKTGKFSCKLAPGQSGEIILQAIVKDEDGQSAYATTSIWVAGKDDWWFSGTDGDRMDLLIENTEYNGGDVAKVQVRSPFRSATALVTIEREGVIDSFVTRISGKTPVIKVPVKPEYAPNVYVSVLAVRGRVSTWQSKLADFARKYDLPLISRDGGEATALIDLAKPAYRLGLANMRVGWQAHRLDVKINLDKPVYRIRETATANIKIARANGGTLPTGSELAIAVVDEALLQLSPNTSWDLLKSMMDERGLEVLTSTAQMQIVGKRHYGRKAVAHGGGGGKQNARELFDTLLLWKGRVRVDENGMATVTFPLNDSLSAFRVVVIAEGGLDLFGTGSSKITTTQDLQILSGLPKVVRENDRFDAAFTVRNASKVDMTAQVGGEITGLGPLTQREITIPAGQARNISWDVLVPFDVSSLDWSLWVTQKDGKAKDAIKVSQSVKPAVPVRTFQASLRQLTSPWSLTVARPQDAIPGRGGVDVRLQSTLGGDLSGVQAYMQRYPYRCFEQRTSIAISLNDKTRWTKTARAIPAYLDKDGLLKYFPSDFLRGSDTLTAYVLAITNEAGWEIPQTQRDQMLSGLTAFVNGKIRRGSPLNTADLTVRKLAAISALARYGRAKPQMLTSMTVDPNLLPTSAVLDVLNIFQRMKTLPNRNKGIALTQQILRLRLNFQGTHMGFSTERSDNLWWLMISADTNAARALIRLADVPVWREDMPRMARGLLSRQMNGHWRTTTGNAWGTLAMRQFSARFEKTKVSGQSSAALGKKRQTKAWGQSKALEFSLPWADKAETLTVAHDGKGAPWAFVTAKAAIPLREPLSSGYAITRTISPVSQAKEGAWNVGDVVRIKLEIDAQSDMTWVVINDPIPAGAQILGGGLGGHSVLLSQDERSTGYAWPVYEERRFDAYQTFYRYVPKGRFSFEYTIRLNTKGDFNLPPTRVEAMYAPEMFGEMPIAPLKIGATGP
ncbi:MAG: MG2 domain-containing protein [Robiginitomaculum sp.]|nr:MG2 domain-containing protein [Robiginitomaculum sp.]